MSDSNSDAPAPLAADVTSGVGTADPSDGRLPYEWQSKYPREAHRHINGEAAYLTAIFAASLVGIYFTWSGVLCDQFMIEESSNLIFKQQCYFIFSGALGGAIFSMKYLYRAVARGSWHLDRKMWRLLSPLVSTGIAFVFGALLSGSFMDGPSKVGGAVAISSGFLVGYFADHAIAKLYEIASVLFGTSAHGGTPKH